jgi:hypothetical protein
MQTSIFGQRCYTPRDGLIDESMDNDTNSRTVVLSDLISSWKIRVEIVFAIE